MAAQREVRRSPCGYQVVPFPYPRLSLSVNQLARAHILRGRSSHDNLSPLNFSNLSADPAARSGGAYRYSLFRIQTRMNQPQIGGR